jgi:hypothetical protein
MKYHNPLISRRGHAILWWRSDLARLWRSRTVHILVDLLWTGCTKWTREGEVLSFCDYRSFKPPNWSFVNAVVGGGNARLAGRSRVRLPMVSLEFFIDVILPTALCPYDRLTEIIRRNISWGKGGRWVRLKPYHLHVPIVLKSGSLNLLDGFNFTCQTAVSNFILLSFLFLCLLNFVWTNFSITI